MDNIDGDGKNLIVRTQNKLYALENGIFEEIRRVDLKNGRYTLIKSQGNLSRVATYNSTLLPQNKLVEAESIRSLLPGPFHYNITKASIGNTFYINYKGSLLEYQINNFYFIAHREKSVRFVYNDDSIRIISSYSGVFIDRDYRLFTNETLPGGNYANGETFKINGTYYLCKDYLYQLKNNTWGKVPIPVKDPAFIKMRELGKRVLYLASNRIGYIDLQAVALDKILFESRSQLTDVEIQNGRIFIASSDGNIYTLGLNGENVKINNIGSPINDINIQGDMALLSCQNGLYEYTLKTGTSKKIFDFNTAVQSLSINENIIVTTFDGLYLINGKKIYNIIPKTEFNKYGLTVFGSEIYAGSIQGLYVINKEQLLFDVLPGLSPIIVLDSTDNSIYWKVLFVIALITLGIIVFYLQKSKVKLTAEIRKKSKITPESIREIMLENENLVSVESIAAYFETSTVQLNRVLKKYNTSGLILLKDIKKDIIKEGVLKGMDLDMIATRVGYSVKYIKKNFPESLG